ncbi:MAG: RIP metalloprotease RseP [Candidatus Omnitrophica bacterium]|nr:RIP metalloprotease RseP [Candidatus Omnitrophota bacterium]
MLIVSGLINLVIIVAVFSVLILVHELGHFVTARRMGVRVERFALGFGKTLFSVKHGETEYAVNLFPLGGYVKLAGEDPYDRKGAADELCSQPVGKRFWIFANGSVANYLFGFLVLAVLYSFGVPTLTAEIGGILKGSPAETAGLKAGDTILSINKSKVDYWDEVTKIIREDKDALPLTVTFNRQGDRKELVIVPKVLSTENIFKQKTQFVGIGIAPGEKVVMVKSNPLKAVNLAAGHVWFFTTATYKGLWFLVTGAMPVKDNVGGPIRIIEILAKSIKYGVQSVLSLLATISMALAIFNMLPFPILDGGHVLFLVVEKIRKKPLSIKVQEQISNVALVLLIAFVLYVSYFDTVRVVTSLRK